MSNSPNSKSIVWKVIILIVAAIILVSVDVGLWLLALNNFIGTSIWGYIAIPINSVIAVCAGFAANKRKKTTVRLV